MTARLEVRALAVARNGQALLHDISFAVGAGERLAVIGPNGAGKSTLLHQLCGLGAAATGALLLDGVPRGTGRAARRDWHRRVGLLFQDPDDQLLAPSVFEDVSFGPMNLGLPGAEVHARVEAALEAVGAAELWDRPVHALSLGEKKRVALAGVLAMEPSVLLLDEPTAGLDPPGVAQLLARLEQERARGVALVVATLDLDFAYAWADRVAVLREGRLVAIGEPAATLGEVPIFGDRPLPPLALRVGLAARAAGLLPAEAPLPRTPAALGAVLEAVGRPRPVPAHLAIVRGP